MPDAGWDDAYLCLAWACTVAMGLIVAVPLRRVGFGLDFGGPPPQDSVDTVFWMYVMTPICFSAHTLLKASFLAFYARIFGSPELGLRFLGMCDLASLLRWFQWLNMLLGLTLDCLSLGPQWVRANGGRRPVNLSVLLWECSLRESARARVGHFRDKAANLGPGLGRRASRT
ncbi:hypothetical protein GGTG_07453 [Gaeumannomyces tritici R3-111a-1]|uniref:Rhodopsin domain-containing protein n=1 Tax=Gaeumannomyces tritici (strain R3-111a-1) TaxID=644352 RepID=J3P1Q5_GAET3|nr:hypothetical protein GGTG_07453 [Gaeumannomyces tritici R3-111a-1]EJT73597.1 hypothetical protein GGTG_07453 [Gaeumannomyces tritici R3-111a-1]